jgi:digeranylgeranylglycerophospholipid reductase
MNGNIYDVIVVGAGPAGSAAAKAIADRGLKAIILEEHTEVGIPTHCWGLIIGSLAPAFWQEIFGSMDKKVILTENVGARVFAPSGKVVKEASLAGKVDYLIQRDVFDRELAKQAVNAGADLRLNTRVTGLLKRDGRVIGVSTSSTNMTNLYAKVVIGADGMHAALRGISKWEGLNRADPTFSRGITLTLTRVRDIELGIRELHTGAFNERGWIGINPIDDVSCRADFATMAEFERVKAGNWVLSKKLREAIPIRMTGWAHLSDYGIGLPELVRDGLILTGMAANLGTTQNAIISARYAAEVAVEAIQEDNVTGKKLSKYESMCKPLARPGHIERFPFSQRSDEDIENLLPALIKENMLLYPMGEQNLLRPSKEIMENVRKIVGRY